MSKNKNKVDRRKFLKMSAVGAAAGGAAIATKTVSAATSFENKTSGYRETQLVKTYYLSTRF
jgi:anaerobic selenocysteine-containing dehydrogenase|tara:strand:- start:230 stop:415 length:186 start_codon:yes stop_codon:yes gene_type:complete